MARPNQEAIETFMNITGASEAVSLQKLEEHGGDLNEAVNAYFGEGDINGIQSTSFPIEQNDFMSIDGPVPVEPRGPLSLLSAAGRLNPFALLEQHFGRGFLDGRGPSDFTNHAPWVSHPREVREIPIEVKDENNQSGHSGSRPTIEDVTGSTHDHVLPEIRGTVITDDEDDKDFQAAPTAHRETSAPQSNSPTDYHRDDIEEEMLKAAIEASKREAVGGHSNQQFVQRPSSPEDIEFAHAVSLSLKTAEQEKALRDQKGIVGTAEQEASHSSGMEGLGKLPTASGRQGFSAFNKDTSSQCELEAGNTIVQEEAVVEEQPLARHRSRRSTSGVAETARETAPVTESQPSSPGSHHIASHPQHNGDAFHSDEWGGISSEEHDEAVMLEAALFGGVPEGSAYQFAYRPHQLLQTGLDGNTGVYPRRVPRPPSPSLTAQRLLREQQDDAYLAALQADQEKEIKAREEAEIRCLEELAAREAALQEQKRLEEEAHRKLLLEEEFEGLLAAKHASLPDEPAIDDESAVTLVVRMPDGSRRGRRFLKSDKLQFLFDFIDIGRVVKPGTYRLVRPYPRRAFSDGESELSLNELGLTSKQEALFLELI